MFNHSSVAYNPGDTFVHRQRLTRVVACYPDPFGFLLKLEEMEMELFSLEMLNSLRAQLGKPPLKSWKESKAKLIDAIAKAKQQLKPAGDDIYPPPAPPKKFASATEEHAAERATKRTRALENATQHDDAAMRRQAQASNVEANGSTFTLSDAANELGMNPKVARAKMRRATDVPADAGRKYTWDVCHLPRIRELLRGAK